MADDRTVPDNLGQRFSPFDAITEGDKSPSWVNFDGEV